MDKYEYKLKLDQMKSFAAEKKYEEAAAIADTINWHKIKNVNTLIRVGEIYEAVGRYEESRDILLNAYDRSPIGRMIIYRLAEVAIKMKNFDEAKDYYQEFVEIAPHDNLRYVLQYRLSKAEGADINTLIGILEELKEQEYSEEWAYQLAYLYHKAGLSEKCVDACDELILWFGDGPYVERALELKMLYEPLSKQQEEKYRQFRQQKEEAQKAMPKQPKEPDEVPQETVPAPQETVSAPQETAPEPQTAQVFNRNLEPERFDTKNLQEELQKSMRQILDATENETVQEIDNSLKINFRELLAEDYDGQISLSVPGGTNHEPQITGQMSIEEVLEDWERTRRDAETAMQEAKQRELATKKAKALREAGDIMGRLADAIPKLNTDLPPKDLLEEQYLSGEPIEEDRAAEMVANMNQILQQEIDRLSDENARMDVKLAYAAELAAEAAKDETAEKDNADDIPDMFAASGVMELVAEDADSSGEEVKTAGTEISETAAEERLEWKSEDGDKRGEASEDWEEDWEDLPELSEEDIDETTVEADDWDGVEREPLTQETVRLPEVEMPADIAEDIIKEAAGARTQRIGDIPEIAKPKEYEVNQWTIQKLTGEQREIFTYFVSISGMEQQICQAMTGIVNHLANGKTASTGNVVILGNQGSGKTVLATGLIKAIQMETGKPAGKIGKIEAASLNTRDAAEILKKVAGGCLIIEKAGNISKETAVKMGLLLANDSSGLLVILEDTRKGIEKALAKDDGFAARFSEKINIPVFTSDELVIFAKSYANELGYTIDEMGVLALYNSISNIQKLDHPTTLIEVKDIVDHAIEKAEKGGLKKAFGILTSRRYDENDYVILYEKDFGF